MPRDILHRSTCPACHGTRINRHRVPCKTCGGTGSVDAAPVARTPVEKQARLHGAGCGCADCCAAIWL